MNRTLIALIILIPVLCTGAFLVYFLQAQKPTIADHSAQRKKLQQQVRALPPQKTAFKKGRQWIVHLHVPSNTPAAFADYCERLLSLIFNRTVEGYGSYRINLVSTASTHDALLADISDDKIDITVQYGNTQAENDLRAVRIPVLRGIAGYHVLLIPEQEQDSFSAIRNLQQLQSLQAGLIAENPIRPALQAAQLPILAHPNKEAVLDFITKHKHDASTPTQQAYSIMPITDAFSAREELAQIAGLRIEKQLCLVCPNPVYFYVDKQDSLLHERLQAGFEQSLFDGSFERLFNKFYTECIDWALLDGRRMLRIPNPSLPAETPFQQRSWWYEPDGL